MSGTVPTCSLAEQATLPASWPPCRGAWPRGAGCCWAARLRPNPTAGRPVPSTVAGLLCCTTSESFAAAEVLLLVVTDACGNLSGACCMLCPPGALCRSPCSCSWSTAWAPPSLMAISLGCCSASKGLGCCLMPARARNVGAAALGRGGLLSWAVPAHGKIPALKWISTSWNGVTC